MFRSLKNWMSGVVLFALIAASVVPASALTISFTTEVGPFKILSSPITPGQTGVDGSHPVEIWRMTFNKPLRGTFIGGIYDPQNGGRDMTGDVDLSGGNGADFLAITLRPTNLLIPGGRYNFDIHTIFATDGSVLDPSDPTTAQYWNNSDNSGTLLWNFTTAFTPGWGSTTVNGADNGLTGGQINVPVVNAVIKVTSKNPLQSGTVIAANVVLHKTTLDGTSVNLGVSLDADGKTVIVTPSGTLGYNTTYYLVLTGVTDSTGTVLP